MNPVVSFVVPCYKLAHLLPECVDSILNQTYTDFEILIMDDVSPDNTAEVVKRYSDPRVKYIRNETNLGNIRNYNKGIRMAAGKYVWLISADDCLRKKHALERYVDVMESHPRVGYVFCPAVRLEDGREGEIIGYSYRGERDRIYKGHRFFAEIITSGCVVVAASGMARKECYEKVSYFPLDLSWGGDWFLWTLYALYYDVAYIAEPMVNYRRHALSMTNALVTERLSDCAEQDVQVPLRIMQKAEEAGHSRLAKICRRAIAAQYANNIASREYRSSDSWHKYSMTPEEFENSLHRIARSPAEQVFIRAEAYAAAGDRHYNRSAFVEALDCYRRALRQIPFMPLVWVKFLLLQLGNPGIRIRSGLVTFLRASSKGAP